MRKPLYIFAAVVICGVAAYLAFNTFLAVPLEDAQDGITGEITRDLPSAAEPGTTVQAQLQFNLSEPVTTDIHERISAGDTVQWHNVSIRNAQNRTISYTIQLPESMSDNLTISGHTSLDRVKIRGDTQIQPLQATVPLYSSNLSTVLPQQLGNYTRTQFNELEGSSGAQAEATATYAFNDDSRQLNVLVFDSQVEAQQHVQALADADNAERREDSIEEEYLIDRGETTFRAWAMSNMYVESETGDDPAFIRAIYREVQP